MNLQIAELDVSMRRRGLIGYTLGMAAYVLIVVALFPAFKDSTNLDSLTSDSPGVAALFGISGSLTSPVGCIYANFFPLIILLLTIGYGASCLAGQEHDGHLELVLSLPFARRRVVAHKVVAMTAQAVGFSVVVFACVLAGRWFQLDVGVTDTATATLGVALLGIDLGLLALAIGAATGHRGKALGITSAVAAASYLVSSMAPVVSWLDPAKYASLFYWAVGDDQLGSGLSIASLVVLVAVGAVLGAVSVMAFEHHDLS